MTYSEAKKYYTYKLQMMACMSAITRLKYEKEEAYPTNILNSIPGAGLSKPTENTALRNVEAEKRIAEQLEKEKAELDECLKRIQAIESYIEGIKDAEAKQLTRLHILENWKFSAIARKIYTSRNYVAKRVKSAFEQ